MKYYNMKLSWNHDFVLIKYIRDSDQLPDGFDQIGRISDWNPIECVIVSGGMVESEEVTASTSQPSQGASAAYNFDVFSAYDPHFAANGRASELLSASFGDCLQFLDVECDLFPLKLVFPFETRPDVIDWERSEASGYFASSRRAKGFKALVIEELDGHPDVFRIDEYRRDTVASHRFVDFVAEHGIKGFVFNEVGT